MNPVYIPVGLEFSERVKEEELDCMEFGYEFKAEPRDTAEELEGKPAECMVFEKEDSFDRNIKQECSAADEETLRRKFGCERKPAIRIERPNSEKLPQSGRTSSPLNNRLPTEVHNSASSGLYLDAAVSPGSSWFMVASSTESEHGENPAASQFKSDSLSRNWNRMILPSEVIFMDGPNPEEMELKPDNDKDSFHQETCGTSHSDHQSDNYSSDLNQRRLAKNMEMHNNKNVDMDNETLPAPRNALSTESRDHLDNLTDKVCVSLKDKTCGIYLKNFESQNLSILSKNIFHDDHAGTENSGQLFECPVCAKTFNIKSNVIRHISLHTGEKPYECAVCAKKFLYKYKVLRHMEVHSHEKPYTCTTCGKNFGHKSSLQRHLVLHTGEKPFVCKVCEKKFPMKHYLTSHMKFHTGEKLYEYADVECPICGNKFCRKSNLKRHMVIHTNEKPYECSICGIRCSQRSYLAAHMKMHTGEKLYECIMCRKKFALRSLLNRHMKLHTGEKPHECNICRKKFYDKFSLLRHERIHTSEKPYECGMCKKKFTRKANVINHLKIHTGEKS